MLEVLRIKNFAIIDQAEIQFRSGLNILSGETGAGKSIIIDAIALVLGSRASVNLIRKGCEEATVEGLFRISELPWILDRLEKSGFSQSELLVKRIVHQAGRHRIFINGELATLTMLQSICEGLIDLCGQHEHQSLLKPSKQLELLDQFGGITKKTQTFSTQWARFHSLRQERDRLRLNESERTKRVDFLQFQINEIREIQPVPGEDESLQKEKQLLQSSALRAQNAELIRQILDSEDYGILNRLQAAIQKLRNLQTMDSRIQSPLESLERSRLEAEEASLFIHNYLNSIEMNAERLQEIQDRLSRIATLRRKYGNSIPEILGCLEKLEFELSNLNGCNDRIEELQNQLLPLEEKLTKSANELSRARKKIAALLGDSVTAELKDLKMEEAVFSVEVCKNENILDWNQQGADEIQYQIQTNRGESFSPLAKTASGGELSRLMLAIRRVIADRGGIGVYLFDEIDAGIGGQTAFQVGKKLRSVAAYNQVICITHLPQVASFADHHLVVRKSRQGKRTITKIRDLSVEERHQELARMLGGPELTHRSLANASELLELARHG